MNLGALHYQNYTFLHLIIARRSILFDTKIPRYMKILPFVIKAYVTKEGGIDLFRNQEKKSLNFFGITSK